MHHTILSRYYGLEWKFQPLNSLGVVWSSYCINLRNISNGRNYGRNELNAYLGPRLGPRFLTDINGSFALDSTVDCHLWCLLRRIVCGRVQQGREWLGALHRAVGHLLPYMVGNYPSTIPI